MIINQHPEWRIIEEWFKKRAKGNYGHTETVTVASCISPEVAKLATDVSRRMGESIARVAERHTQGT